MKSTIRFMDRVAVSLGAKKGILVGMVFALSRSLLLGEYAPLVPAFPGDRPKTPAERIHLRRDPGAPEAIAADEQPFEKPLT